MLASSVLREIHRARIGFESIAPVGSLRRFAPDVGRVALLGVAPLSHHSRVIKSIGRLPIVSAIKTAGAGVTLSTARGDITVCLSTPENAGAALVRHTGSAAHVQQLQERADRLGLHFSDGHLLGSDGLALPCSTEEELYARLELPFIPPEVRNGEDEIALAERRGLPTLLSELHIRGDLHMHSTWSDGRNSIAEMVSAAAQIGYEYVAITDHSQHAFSTRKLAAEDVPRQRDEIAAVREEVRGIEILHGVEVDIMHDGSLDFDDELLAGFDIVLASLHDHAGHDDRRLTERYLSAIRHPLVNVITHPANRSPGVSSGYGVDFDALFAAAAETGTAMEIDGAPGHLDMDGAIARRAAHAGVTIAVDSDCHRSDALARQMRFGVGTARRGWIEPRHVLNTRAVSDVRAFVARKRARS